MHTRLRYARCLVIALMGLSAFAVPQTSFAQTPSPKALEHNSRNIIAAIPRSWPPDYSVDNYGNPSGFAIDIMNAVADQIGYSVEYRIAPNFPEATKMFDAGKADVIPLGGITAERLKTSTFTAPVETFHLSIITRKSTHNLNRQDRFRGLRIGVVRNNIGEKFMNKHKDAILVVHEDIQKALFSLLSGREEAIIFPRSVIMRLAHQIGVDGQIKVSGPPLLEIKRAIRIHNRRPELAKVLVPVVENFVHSPQYHQIYLKWYGTNQVFWTAEHIGWAVGAIIIGVLVLMAGWRYASVFILNKELRNAIALREQAEKQSTDQTRILKTTIDAMAQGFVAYDADLRLISFNQRFEKQFNFPKGFLHLGLYLEDVIRKTGPHNFSGQGNDNDKVIRHLARAKEPVERTGERETDAGITYVYHRTPLPNGGFVTTYTDITERKQTERALQESEERFRKAFDNARVGIAIRNLRDDTLTVNPALVNILGYSAAEMKRMRMRDITLPEDWSQHTLERETLMAKGTIRYQSTMRYMRKDESIAWIINDRSMVNDDEGNPLYVINVNQDVTEQKLAEEEAVAKNLLLETTMGTMAQGLAVYDADLHLIRFNDHVGEILGLPKGFLYEGMPMEEILRERKKMGQYEGRDIEKIVHDHYDVLGGDTFLERTAERRTNHKGTVFITHHKRMPGNVLVTTLTDITDLAKAEGIAAEKSALLSTTFNNVDQGISVYNSQLELVAYNQRFVDLGEFPQDMIKLGKNYEDLIRFSAARNGLSPSEIDQQVRDRLESIQKCEKYENEITHNSTGTTILIHRTTMPGGGFTITFTDVTERKVAEEKIRIAMEDAESANRTKSEFLANMSHELHTPLNAVIGFSDIMKNGSFGPLGNEKYLEYAEDIHNSGQHLLSLINDILDLSKVEAGKMDISEETFDPMVVIQSCLKMMRGQARNGGLHLGLENPDTAIALYADQRKFKQIILNLLSNAIKFTQRGGHITVKVWAQTHNGYIVQVIDNGNGIPAEDIPRVLQPFTQIESLLNRRHQGTGLGLPLTKQLIELQGGTLDIQSEVGVGTIVSVRFPKDRIVPDANTESMRHPPVA